MAHKFLTTGNVFNVLDESTVIFEGRMLKVSKLKVFESSNFDVKGEYIFESTFPNMPLFAYPTAKGGTFMPEESWTIIAHRIEDSSKKIWFTQHKQ